MQRDREGLDTVTGIIWLASYPKSGNTWLRAFLANLLHGGQQPLPINDLKNYVYGDGFLVHFAQLSGKREEELTDDDIHRLRPQIHMWFARAKAPQDVFVKTHNALVTDRGQPMITPEATAGAIYVVRNPLDVAVSYAHHYQTSYDAAVEQMCDPNHALPPSGGVTMQALCDWTRHYRTWTQAPGLTRHIMRYEDMKRDPHKAFGKLVKFLGMPKDPAGLKRAIKHASFRELSRQEQKDSFVEARPDGTTPFFRKGKAGSWREELSADQVQRLLDAHGELMTELGYLRRDGKVAA
jgi:LPS sulfotransferase NodH